MSPRRVVPIVIGAGFTLVFGCSYDWNVGGATSDAGPIPVVSASSSSSSGATITDAGKPTPPTDASTAGNCGNNCTCKDSENCDFTCELHRTCKLTCTDKSSCKFTCPLGSTCEIKCEKNAKCDFTCNLGSECTASCDDTPTCKGACVVGAECTNKCGNRCDVKCMGSFAGSTVCNLK